MLRGLSKDQVPVLYQINNLHKDGFNYFKLDNEEYYLIPYEQEVLVYTGLDFKIIHISE